MSWTNPLTAETEDYRYTPQFCEENIWHLARRFRDSGLAADRMFVLLFSNPNRSIVLCHQKIALPNRFVLWDYHVVLHAHFDRVDWIYDFDTRLPFSCQLADYFSLTVPDQDFLPEIYHMKIRRIPAHTYLTRFCSDRSHMLGKIPADRFPEYPAIVADAAVGIPPITRYPFPIVNRSDCTFTTPGTRITRVKRNMSRARPQAPGILTSAPSLPSRVGKSLRSSPSTEVAKPGVAVTLF